MRFTLFAAAFLLLGLGAAARAQSAECKPDETEPECFARLKCHADEDLDQCKKRLAAEHEHDGSNRDRGDRSDDRDRGDRGDDRSRRDDRGDRGDDRSRRDDRGEGDRGDRGERGGRRGRARGGRHGGGGGHGFEANKTFGLGLELGEPTGINGKYFFSDRAAFDFGVGWFYHPYYYGDGVNLYGDLLFHPVSLASTDAFELPFYIGAGLRFWDFQYCYQNVCNYHDSAVGVRIPIGIAFDFNRAPLDIFLQVVPTIDFLGGAYYDRYGDRAHAGVDFSLGFRFWFD